MYYHIIVENLKNCVSFISFAASYFVHMKQLSSYFFCFWCFMVVSLQVQDHTFIWLELWSSDLWQQEKPKLHHWKQWGLWGLFHHLPHDHRSCEDRVGQQNRQKQHISTCYFKDTVFAPPFLVLVFTKQNFVTFIVNKLCIFFLFTFWSQGSR